MSEEEQKIPKTAPRDKRLDNLREPWKPGQSGNPSGRPKGSVATKTKVRTFLDDYFKYKKSKGFSKAAARKELMSRWNKLSKKDVRALTYVSDRIYGKETEKIEHTGLQETIMSIEEMFQQIIKSKQHNNE